MELGWDRQGRPCDAEKHLQLVSLDGGGQCRWLKTTSPMPGTNQRAITGAQSCSRCIRDSLCRPIARFRCPEPFANGVRRATWGANGTDFVQ